MRPGGAQIHHSCSESSLSPHSHEQASFVIFVLIILAAMLGLFLLDEYYKKRYVVVYLLICSLSGSLTVMSVKGVSTAVILTLSGEQNAFTHLLPWFLVVTLTVTAVIQVPRNIIAHGCSSARA